MRHFARERSEQGNKYAITALKDRRATMAGEVERHRRDIEYRLEQLAHIDAVLRVLDPEYRADTIAPKKLRQVKLFGHGQLNRLIHDALRRANGKALTCPEIAEAIIATKGYGHDAKGPLIRRVGANLRYLQRQRKTVQKTGERLAAKWTLIPD